LGWTNSDWNGPAFGQLLRRGFVRTKGEEMKRFLIATLLIVTVWAGSALGAEPRDTANAFFKMVQEGKVSEAYDDLFKGSPLPSMKPQALELLKRQTSANLPMYGAILSVESLREEKLGTSIVRLVYVMKLEKHPVIWEFHFYKPKGDWFLSNIQLNDEFKMMH
jgi:hypothetical protein